MSAVLARGPAIEADEDEPEAGLLPERGEIFGQFDASIVDRLKPFVRPHRRC